MKFHPDDEDDDDDSSSVIDVEFLNESTLEILAAQRPSTLTNEGATSHDALTNDTWNLKPLPESNDDKSTKPKGTQQHQVQETVRVIFGDSITRWRERSLPPKNDSSRVLVWKQTTGTTSMVWQNSRLRVDDESQEPCLQAENGSSYVPKEMIEPETSSSSTFVEAVGIWDPTQQAYRLEIPQRIAIDLMPSNRQNQSQLADPGLARGDPWTQAREAEEALLRKRKQQRPNTSVVKRPLKRGTATFMKSFKR